MINVMRRFFFVKKQPLSIEEVCVTVEAASVEDLSEIIYRNLFRQVYCGKKFYG